MSVEIERDGAVWVVTLSRPERRNAVDRPTAEALAQAFREFEQDESARVAILAGAGGHFCAGADLKAVHEGRSNRLEREGDGPMGPSRMQLCKPVIAAVSGFAVAGGLELALWCDLRIVEESATFGVFCRRFGVPLIDGGSVRLPQIVGLGRALDLILTGRPVDAQEAERIGLANRVVPDGTALAAARALATELVALPQTCMKNDRKSAYGAFRDDAMAREFELGLKSLASGEAQSGAARFTGGAGRHGRRN
ncbi:MAG: crotonase/enoyl-CoA hydratase family protein [Myxococcota bacterium]